jgi:hypothetical protein
MNHIPPLAPEQLITVALQAQEWNWLLDIVIGASVPYRLSAPLIGKISQQALAAAQSIQAPPQISPPRLHAVQDETGS